MRQVAQALLALLERGSTIPVEYDPEWPSPCALLPPDVDGMVFWFPVPMDSTVQFDGVQLHPDLRELYGSFWGGHVEGRHSEEVVHLHLPWNFDELGSIVRSLVSQAEEGTPVFVAGTDSDWYFGADNYTGIVWLCEPGYPPIRKVAVSIAAFLAEVQ